MSNLIKNKIYTLNCKGYLLVLDRPIVMGILNITPDSFYKNSRVETIEKVIESAHNMIADGATILDLGAMSTRPNAPIVRADEEADRLFPVIEAIVKAFPNQLISIDTISPIIAHQALSMGAHIINDVSGAGLDYKIIDVCAEHKAPYVLMHSSGIPNTSESPIYTDVEKDVLDFFIEKIDVITKKNLIDIIIDPGFGFSKDLDANYILLNHLKTFELLDRPIMVGLSRKSMIYKYLDISPENALNGTTVLQSIAIQNGAKILRTHDVKATIETIKLLEKVNLHS
jgi:dihydropteroate synthase